jgi:membrane-associated HD superfamily phosphohydrolase
VTPTSIEAVILMICDRLEARSRAESQKRQGEFDASVLINDAFNELERDRQLDIVTLGMKRNIIEAFEKELQGTYQKRVDYEEAGKKSTNEGE